MSFRAEHDFLLQYDPPRSRTTVNVWVGQPTLTAGDPGSAVFLLSEIESAARVNHEVIEVLQTELQQRFFENESGSLERRLEESLQATNRRLHSLIADGVQEWLGRSRFLAGAWNSTHVALAPVRTVHSFVLRGHRLHDVLGVTDDAAPNPLRVFGNITTGSISAGDKFLFCLPSLLDYFSLEKLRRTLLEHHAAEATRSLEQSLLGVDPSMSFGALILELRPAESLTANFSAERHEPAAGHLAPQRSMSSLIETERSTARILSPSIWPIVRESWNRLSRFFSESFRRFVLRRPPRRAVEHPPVTPSQIKPQAEWMRFLKIMIGDAMRNFRDLFSRTIYWVQARRRRPDDLPLARPHPVATAGAWWSRTTPTQRWLLAGALLCVLLLTSLLARPGSKPSPDSTAGTTASEIDAALTRAEAALLYGGESVAQENISGVESTIASLPSRSKSDQQTRDSLQARYLAILEKIAHREILGDPKILASLGEEAKAEQLYFAAEKILAVDPNRQSFARITLRDTKAIDAKPTIDIGHILTGTTIQNNVVFVTDRLGLVEFNPDRGTWTPFDATFPNSQPTIQALGTYNNRIYLLDRNGSRILRFTRGRSSYGSFADWLKVSVDFSQARDLAVDGSIFVLSSNGRVTEYLTGRPTNFKLGPVAPPVKDPTRLWTNTESNRLYVLDPAQNRLLVFNKKDGVLIKQWTSPDWHDLRAFVVDETGQRLFVSDSTRILQYTLP